MKTKLVLALMFASFAAGCSASNSGDRGTASPPNANLKTALGESESCLLAREPGDLKALVCSTQGIYTFIELSNLDPSKLEDLKLSLFDKNGDSLFTASNPKVTKNGSKINLIFSSDDHLSFKQIDFQSDKFNFGFVIIGGNSGSCQPVRSGSAKTCYQTFKNHKGEFDDFSIPEINAAKSSVKFLYDKVNVEDRYHPYSAWKYCASINGRLPTNRELAQEIESRSGHRVIMETKFPDVVMRDENTINNVDLQNEVDEMKRRGFLKALKSAPSGWSVDFYMKGYVDSNYAGDFICEGIRARSSNPRSVHCEGMTTYFTSTYKYFSDEMNSYYSSALHDGHEFAVYGGIESGYAVCVQ